MNKEKKLIIFDTTLRDGEQAPGASLNEAQKIEVARQLEQLGVDIIEAGFPISSPGDFAAVKKIASCLKRSTVCGLARALEKDIDAAYQAMKHARRYRIHVFLATSKIHMQYKLQKAEDEILKLAKKAVAYARNLSDDVEFSPEDASRTEPDFLFKVIEGVIDAGARTINIPDTVGWAYPEQFGGLIESIFNTVPNMNKAIISVHCHNDLGLAVANSLAAVKSGAQQVHCTINGLGERAGNASLEETVMAINVRKDIFTGIKLGIDTKELYKTSKLVSYATGFTLAPNKAIVGQNAFRHESGIHQDGVIKERTTYEIIDPAEVGFQFQHGTQLVLGKHSGRHAFIKRLKELGYELTKEQIEECFEEFKQLADKKKEVFDEDLEAIIEEQTETSKKEALKLISMKIQSGTNIKPCCTLKVKFQNKVHDAISTGDGPVDACYRAIDSITKLKTKLQHYKLEAVTSGKDALGHVRVELSVGKKVLTGVAASTDVVEASAKAYIAALNKL